jgi:hypothetical protein
MIIFSSKIAIFLAIEMSTTFDPGFHFLDFATIIPLQGKVVSLASNPQSGGPDPYIFIPYWQDGPVVSSDTGIHSSTRKATMEVL